MSRLHAELQRLYALSPSAPADGAPAGPDALCLPSQAGADTRLLVLGLGRPADWPRLAAVWQAVQAELGLPAPAIAVNGVDGFQLWFALARPLPLAQAAELADALRQRYLGDVPPARVSVLPALPGQQPAAAPAQLLLPGCATGPEQWSAFVAPDLAPMFAETPWLDLPPPLDGQAELLARLQPISADALAQALAQLAPPAASRAAVAGASTAAGAEQAVTGSDEASPSQAPATATTAAADEARRFLLRVMNDEQAALALRIEAAKALLAGPSPRR